MKGELKVTGWVGRDAAVSVLIDREELLPPVAHPKPDRVWGNEARFCGLTALRCLVFGHEVDLSLGRNAERDHGLGICIRHNKITSADDVHSYKDIRVRGFRDPTDWQTKKHDILWQPNVDEKNWNVFHSSLGGLSGRIPNRPQLADVND